MGGTLEREEEFRRAGKDEPYRWAGATSLQLDTNQPCGADYRVRDRARRCAGHRRMVRNPSHGRQWPRTRRSVGRRVE